MLSRLSPKAFVLFLSHWRREVKFIPEGLMYQSWDSKSQLTTKIWRLNIDSIALSTIKGYAGTYSESMAHPNSTLRNYHEKDTPSINLRLSLFFSLCHHQTLPFLSFALIFSFLFSSLFISDLWIEFGYIRLLSDVFGYTSMEVDFAVISSNGGMIKRSRRNLWLQTTVDNTESFRNQRACPIMSINNTSYSLFKHQWMPPLIYECFVAYLQLSQTHFFIFSQQSLTSPEDVRVVIIYLFSLKFIHLLSLCNWKTTLKQSVSLCYCLVRPTRSSCSFPPPYSESIQHWRYRWPLRFVLIFRFVKAT